jgi:hypothetical protein
MTKVKSTFSNMVFSVKKMEWCSSRFVSVVHTFGLNPVCGAGKIIGVKTFNP